MVDFSENRATFAIVGVGSIGLRHANNLRMLRPEARIVAVSTSLSSRGGLSAFPMFNALYESLDAAIDAEELIAVLLANPASLHVLGLVCCIEAKLPVFVEKPLAHTLSAAAIIESVNVDHFPFVSVGYNLRYSHGLQKIKQLLEDGVLGRVMSVRAEVGQYLPDWRPKSDYRKTVTAQRNLGGGVLLELSHELDYLQYLFGNPISVQAQLLESGLLDMDAEDQADLICCYTDSFGDAKHSIFAAQIHLDCLQRRPHRSLRIVGSLATLEWNLLTSSLSVYIFDPSSEVSYWQFPEDLGNWVYLSELEAFLLAVEYPDSKSRRADSIATSFIQGQQTLAVIDAARKASSTGQRQIVTVSAYAAQVQKGLPE